jgi:hypothetical protein
MLIDDPLRKLLVEAYVFEDRLSDLVTRQQNYQPLIPNPSPLRSSGAKGARAFEIAPRVSRHYSLPLRATVASMALSMAPALLSVS